VFLLGITACTAVQGLIPKASHPVSAELVRIPVEAKHARPSQSRLDEHLISFDASQFPEGSVCLVHEQGDGSFQTVTCQPVGTKDLLFYVPYPGDRYYLAGDNWRSENNLSEACVLHNAYPKGYVAEESQETAESASGELPESAEPASDEAGELTESTELTESGELVESTELAESGELAEPADSKPTNHNVVLDVTVNGRPILPSLTERQMMDMDHVHPDMQISLLCVMQRTSPVQKFFMGLFSFLFWVLIGYSCFQCFCGIEDQSQEVLLVQQGDIGCPTVQPSTNFEGIHIVEQPAHVPVEQAFVEQPCDRKQSGSPTPNVTITEDPVFNDTASQTKTAL